MGNKHHEHSHGIGHNHHNGSSNIKLAFFLNFGFTIIEFIGGVLTNSIAIMADAVHDLGDTFSLGLAWKLENISKKGRTKKYSYGYKRFSILGALINSLVLIAGSVYVLMESIPRIINPESSDYLGMFALALLGISINGYAAYKTTKGKSLNEKVISWHLLEDVLGWVGILIISIVNFVIEVPILDPLLAIFFTLFILWNVIKNLKQIIKIFMQSVPGNLNMEKIEEQICKIKGVVDVHDIHVWTMDNEDNIITLHVVIDDDINIKKIKIIKEEVRKLLNTHKINHTTIEFDFKKEECKYESC